MGARLRSVVLDCPDPRELASFYRQLLGWTVIDDEDGWVKIGPPGGGVALAFQPERNYTAPTWPSRPGEPAMMAHLDIAVDDLDRDCARAVELGALMAETQPQDDVRVLLDPVGHPFCLFVVPVAD